MAVFGANWLERTVACCQIRGRWQLLGMVVVPLHEPCTAPYRSVYHFLYLGPGNVGNVAHALASRRGEAERNEL